MAIGTKMGDLGSGTFGMPVIPGISPSPAPKKTTYQPDDVENLTTLSPLQKEVINAYKEQNAFDTMKQQTELTQKGMLAKGQAKAEKTFAEERQPEELTSELKKQVKEASMPFIPTERNAADLGLIFTITNILGFGIGKGAKGNAQAALSAQNGMLEGYRKGDQEQYKREKDKFEEAQKALSKSIEGLRYELTQAEKTASVNKDLALAQVNEAVAKYGADTLGEYIKTHGLPKGKEILEKYYQMDKDNQDRLFKQQQEADKLAYQKLVSAETKRHNLAEEDIQRAKSSGVGKIDREVLNEATKYYPELKPENLTNLSKEGVKRIVAGLDTIKSIEEVAKYIQQNPQAVGATAKIKNFINLDAIKSVTGDADATASQKSQIIDSQVDDAVRQGKITADEARSAKVLNKMLFTVALSDVARSGQRGSIFLDKKFQDIYDQASRLGTLAEILHKRIEDADRSLGVVDMNIENRSDKDSFPLTTMGGDAWMNQNFPKLSPSDVEKKLKDGTLKNGSWFRGTDDIPRQINLGR
jgi:hypothetical protein